MARKDAILLWADREWMTVSNPKDRCFGPLLSPCGRYLLFRVLGRGIFLYDIALKETRSLGPGSDPAWSPGGDWVIFSRPLDDGERIVSSDLYSGRARDGAVFKLLETPDRIERHPVLSPDGALITWNAGNETFTAPIDLPVERPPTHPWKGSGTPPPGPLPGERDETQYRICIDPGHGGSDPGATGFGANEKDVNLDIALRARHWLQADTLDTGGGGSWEILMTRETDVAVSLADRVAYANSNGVERFISIHCNAFSDPLANGTETYSRQEGTTSADLRDCVQVEAIEHWNLRDRGSKTADFYVLVHTTMPAALHECGFITNPGDFAVLTDPVMQDEAGRYLLHAVQNHFGIPDYDPRTGFLKGVVYDASVGPGAPVEGAAVVLHTGENTSTSASGYYEFHLPEGTYGITAWAPGFDPGWSSDTVVSPETWESVGMPPRAGPGLYLDDTTPPVGGTMTFTIEGAAGSTWVLVGSQDPAVPPFNMGITGYLGIDTLSSYRTLGGGALPPGGIEQTWIDIPPNPGLAGLPAFFQAYIWESPPRLTNLVAATFR